MTIVTTLKRRCPVCETVATSDRFPPVRTGAKSSLLWPLRCTACGHVGPAREFRIEPRAGGRR